MSRKLTTDEFIERSKVAWCEKLCYTKTVYKGRDKKVILICKEHNHEFEQLADANLKGKNGCKFCRYYTTKSFIEKSKQVWGDNFDYSKTKYLNYKKKVYLICKEHNHEFEHLPNPHLQRKNGCLYCNDNTSNVDKFIKKSKQVWGDNFDYSKTKYVNKKTKVKIICKEHNHEFEQRPDNHLIKLNGCQKCMMGTLDKFVIEAKQVWGDNFDYSKTKYIRIDYKIKIICKEHNHEFEQRGYSHLNGKNGCKFCNNGDTDIFINKANKIHNNKYDYSLVEYNHSREKVIIKCHKHGIFEQTPNNHLRNNGCPSCKISKGEEKIKLILEKYNINFTQQKTFEGCKDKDLLKFDFYIPSRNLCIEYDGIQHFKPVEHWGGEKGLNNTKKRDKLKNIYCLLNNIKIIRISYNSKNIEEKIKTFII